MIMGNEVKIEECQDYSPTRICWSAIFAGAIVGVGLGFILHLFGFAMGLSAYQSATNGSTAVAMGGILGLLISVIVSMGIAGCVAGLLGRNHHCYCHGGVIYGFMTWSLSLILSAILFLPLIHYVGAYTKTLSHSVVQGKSLPSTGDTSTINSPIKSHDQENTASKATTTDLAWSGWLVFILFIAGAFSCCIGACYGMSFKRQELLHHAHSFRSKNPSPGA